MNYMMDKINLLENKGAIIEGAEEIVKLLLLRSYVLLAFQVMRIY